MRLRFGIALLLPALFLPVTASAQFPRGPRPWWDGQLAKDLNLTDAQTKQIRQTQDDFRPRMFAASRGSEQSGKRSRRVVQRRSGGSVQGERSDQSTGCRACGVDQGSFADGSEITHHPDGRAMAAAEAAPAWLAGSGGRRRGPSGAGSDAGHVESPEISPNHLTSGRVAEFQ